MGLGLYIIGHRKPKGLLRIPPSKEKLMKNMASLKSAKLRKMGISIGFFKGMLFPIIV